MTKAKEFIEFVARIALDRITGSSERTDEGIRILKEWVAQRNTSETKSDIADAKVKVSEKSTIRNIVGKIANKNDQKLDNNQLDDLEFSIMSSISSASVSEGSGNELVDEIVKQLMPGKSRSYIIWLDVDDIVDVCGEGRYFHFSYDGESYRLRDYIGGNIFHQPGVRVTDKVMKAIQLNMKAAEIWKLSKWQIRCTKEYGLYVSVSQYDEWLQRLLLITKVATKVNNER